MYRSQPQSPYQPIPQQQQQQTNAWATQQRYQQRNGVVYNPGMILGRRYDLGYDGLTLEGSIASPTTALPMQSVNNSPQTTQGQWPTSPSATQAGYSAPVVQPSSASPNQTSTISSTTSSPIIPTQAQQVHDIYMRNNKRLAALAQEMQSEATYGPACDEFREWLSDRRAYHPSNEAALMRCAGVSMIKKSLFTHRDISHCD